MKGEYLACGAMSEEQLAALLTKLKDDAGLQEKLKGAADLDAAIALAKEAGFEVSKADWLNYEAKQTIELSDGELESVAGGVDWNDVQGNGERLIRTATNLVGRGDWSCQPKGEYVRGPNGDWIIQ